VHTLDLFTIESAEKNFLLREIMPPKAISGGSSAKDGQHIDRISLLSVSNMSSPDAFRFFCSKIASLKPFEASWLEHGLSGNDLLRLDPFSFTSELAKEFPDMPPSLRNRLFEQMKAKIAIDFAKNTESDHVISIPTGEAWASTELGATAPTVMQRYSANHQQASNLLPIQSGNMAPTHAPPPLETQTPAAKAAPFVFGPRVTPQTLRYDFPLPHGQNSAAPMPALAGQQPGSLSSAILPNASPMPALAGQMLSQPASAAVGVPPPPVRPPPSGVANAPMPALAGQRGENDSNVPLIPLAPAFNASSSDFVYHSSPKLPWVKASEARAVAEVNPNFPVGFSEINMHQLMQLAIQERLKKPLPISFQAAIPVVWPKCEVFDREHFIATRTLYYKAVLESMSIGLFQEFKSTFTTSARLALCLEFHLDQTSFIATDDSKILEYCEIHFGPKNARQAIRALEACKMESHRDKDHSQSTFVAKFDNLRLTFELVVNDLVKCHNYWPTDTEDVEYGVVTIKNVMTAWANIFPKPSFKGHPISIQMVPKAVASDVNNPKDLVLVMVVPIDNLHEILAAVKMRLRNGTRVSPGTKGV
jgi:hypothetical protein